MKKAVAVPALLVGLALLGLGVYAIGRGFDARDQVHDRLAAQDITTPAGASIPNARVDDAATAQSLADFIDGTVSKATGGRNYSQVGRYLTATGAETNDAAAAAVGPDNLPVPNPLRQTAFELSTASTGLYNAVIGSEMGDVAIGIGIVMLLLGLSLEAVGVAMGGLAVPADAVRRVHLPHVTPHHA